MKFVLFYHSLLSDWNHGNAHFLRGVVSELLGRGHAVEVYEPVDSWSLENLLAGHGERALEDFYAAYPQLSTIRYDKNLDLEAALDGADVVIVHEWNAHRLVRMIGEYHAQNRSFLLFFHDTHHRSVTDPSAMAAYDLEHYDGVLAFGEKIRQIYLENEWTARAWTWHEAADTRVFYPREATPEGDLVWIGNWGDEERSAELSEFLLKPVKELGLKATIHGVRYPEEARSRLREAGIDYRGWLPNFKAPEVFARYRATVHVPRRPYAEALPGIPTIRVFEALACGIPLVSAPWLDAENLFRPGTDFLVARDGQEMKKHLRELLGDEQLRQELVRNGLATIRERHTCGHRAEELLNIIAELKGHPAKEETVEITSEEIEG